MAKAQIEPIFEEVEWEHPEWSWAPNTDSQKFASQYAAIWNNGAPIKIRNYQDLESVTFLRYGTSEKEVHTVPIEGGLYPEFERASEKIDDKKETGELLELRRDKALMESYHELAGKIGADCKISNSHDSCLLAKNFRIETIILLHYFKNNTIADQRYFSIFSETNYVPTQDELSDLFARGKKDGRQLTIQQFAAMDTKKMIAQFK